MALKPAEDKSLEGSVAANGVSTVNADTGKNVRDVEVTLAAHYTDPDGKDHLPGDKIKVRPAAAQALRTAGYAARED